MGSNIVLNIYGAIYHIHPTIPVTWLLWAANELMVPHDLYYRKAIIKTITTHWSEMNLSPKLENSLLKDTYAVINRRGTIRLKATL